MKRSTMYRVGEFDVLLFETGETLAFGHDPETGHYTPMENHAAQSAIKTAQDWQIADAANADVFPECFHTGVLDTTDRAKLLADASMGWGCCIAGATPPPQFGIAMQAIGDVLGIVPLPENISAEANKWIAENLAVRP